MTPISRSDRPTNFPPLPTLIIWTGEANSNIRMSILGSISFSLEATEGLTPTHAVTRELVRPTWNEAHMCEPRARRWEVKGTNMPLSLSMNAEIRQKSYKEALLDYQNPAKLCT
ncbi:hypothetical protein MPER_09487, partial [Moniliophthora perniciosa FA553]